MAKKNKLPELIVVHGWTFDTGMWTAFVKEAENRGVKVRILRTPGLTAPLEEPWGLEEYVKWLKDELRDRSGYVVLGHSFGGQIAAALTASTSGSMLGLVLMDAAGVRDMRLMKRVKRWVFEFAAKVGRPLARFDLLRKGVHWLAGERDYYRAKKVMREVIKRVTRTDISRRLGRIRVPTLILWGGEDLVTPVFMAELFHREINQSRLVVIDGASHSPQSTHPARVAAEVVAFLGKLQLRTSD